MIRANGMIPLALCLIFIVGLIWVCSVFGERIEAWLKRDEPTVTLKREDVDVLLDACDLIMELNPPESDEYRLAAKTKLEIERSRK